MQGLAILSPPIWFLTHLVFFPMVPTLKDMGHRGRRKEEIAWGHINELRTKAQQKHPSPPAMLHCPELVDRLQSTCKGHWPVHSPQCLEIGKCDRGTSCQFLPPSVFVIPKYSLDSSHKHENTHVLSKGVNIMVIYSMNSVPIQVMHSLFLL